LLLVIPGLILLTIWAISAPVAVLERPLGVQALDRRRDLVHGNDWRVFAVVVVPFILVPAIGLATVFAHRPETIATLIAVRVVAGTLVVPLAAAVLYFDLLAAAPDRTTR
jgi:hypothetical protein